jgi:hypothetical protein
VPAVLAGRGQGCGSGGQQLVVGLLQLGVTLGFARNAAFSKTALLYQAPIPSEMKGTPPFTPSNVMPSMAAVLILESQPYFS